MDFKEDKLLKIKLCYTVKGLNYAIALANTLKMCDIKYPVIYAYDDESYNYLKSKGYTTNDISEYYSASLEKSSTQLSVYHEKFLNGIRMSIANPDTLILVMDSMIMTDIGEAPMMFRKHEDYIRSKPGIFIVTSPYYDWSFKDRDAKTICGGIAGFYNCTQEDLDTYIKCYNDLANSYDAQIKDYNHNEEWYRKQNAITDEELFENYIYNGYAEKYPHKISLTINFDDNKDIHEYWLQGTHDGFGSYALKTIIETKQPNYNCHYFFLPEYFNDLMKANYENI